MCKLFVVGIALLLAASAPVAAQDVSGTWKLSYVTNGAFEQTTAIIKLKRDGDKTTGELVAGNPRLLNLTLKSVGQDGSLLRVVLNNGAVDMVFETAVPKEVGKHLKGVVAIDSTLYPAWLSATDEATLDAKSTVRLFDCPPMQQARTLANRANTLRIQAQLSKDPEKKKDLLRQAADADKTAKAETPKLYREVLAKHADSPAASEAALILIRAAQSSGAKSEDVKAWAAAASSAAKGYGSRWQGEMAAQVAVALLGQDGHATLAVEYARQAERSLNPQSSASDQVRVLSLLAWALRKTGADDEAKKFDGRIAKLDDVLDREYLAKMPGFKGAVFEGRKTKSDRAVFMELFTGAMCPPCVAADLAFDVLQKSYKPSELVLIQYHLHIPGADPLTNPDTEARWAYYTKAYPKEVRGVPSSIFNGKPRSGGGGGIANAEKKYGDYRGVIDPLLEEPSGAKISAQARRDGDRIEIFVKVADLAEPDPNKKLRILLAEETVRYVGSNKIRMHHNVVRAFPSGVAGMALTEAASRHKASINLAELRGSLTKYLDDYQANVRPFFNPARPLDLSQLRVIAFVQDDITREILQAAQVEVKTK
ncbi:MAG: hypothetical protein EXR98_01650 [Gemmataceae bacterium]|nr:hypothetical protein [Gemmataceae bacterium]